MAGRLKTDVRLFFLYLKNRRQPVHFSEKSNPVGLFSIEYRKAVSVKGCWDKWIETLASFRL